MIRARESSDNWAQYACHLLDRARSGGPVASDRIEWALAYLGDKPGSVKVPVGLMTANRWRPHELRV